MQKACGDNIEILNTCNLGLLIILFRFTQTIDGFYKTGDASPLQAIYIHNEYCLR
jgi:hypothetical protein